MANIRFFTINNWWNASATGLSASSAAAALPAAFSATPERTKVWRSMSETADQTLVADLGGAAAITCCGVANVRLQNGGSLKLQRSSDGSAWTDVGTFPDADTDSGITYLVFSSLSYRYWRLLCVNGNGAVADYAEIGFVYLGQYFEPTVNVSVPLDIDRIDPSVLTPSPDGQVTTTQRQQYATWTNRFEAVDESTLTSFRAMFRTVGTFLPFFVIVDDGLAWAGWMARVSGALRKTARNVPGLYDVAIACVEER